MLELSENKRLKIPTWMLHPDAACFNVSSHTEISAFALLELARLLTSTLQIENDSLEVTHGANVTQPRTSPRTKDSTTKVNASGGGRTHGNRDSQHHSK